VSLSRPWQEVDEGRRPCKTREKPYDKATETMRRRRTTEGKRKVERGKTSKRELPLLRLNVDEELYKYRRGEWGSRQCKGGEVKGLYEKGKGVVRKGRRGKSRRT
jgi:hypothetical protein